MACDDGEIYGFRQMADLIRADHPTLARMVLEPDAAYQTRQLTVEAMMGGVTGRLAAGWRDRDPADLPTIIYAWGKARVGSTALTNLFGMAGLPAYYQPVKAIVRQVLMGQDGAPWTVPSRRLHPHVFAKETAGPYSLAECLYMPLQALIDAGYPARKLQLIMLDRTPADSLASWLDKWSGRVPAERLARHHILASLNGMRVEAHARRSGVAVTHYVYEASRDPVRAARVLFLRLGLADRFTAAAVTDWQGRGNLESADCGIIYPDEPAVYQVPGLHGTDTAYRYRERRKNALTEAQMALMAEFGLDALYRASVAACSAELGSDLAETARLPGFAPLRHGTAA